MRIVNIREARAGLSELVDTAQKQLVCLTRHGKPVAVLTGVEGADLGTVILENSRQFWEEIERRRRSRKPRKSIEQIRTELAHQGSAEKKRAGSSKRR